MAAQFVAKHYTFPPLEFESDMKSLDGKRRKKRSSIEIFQEKMTALMLLTAQMYRDVENCIIGPRRETSQEDIAKVFEIKGDFETLLDLVDYFQKMKDVGEVKTRAKKKRESDESTNMSLSLLAKEEEKEEELPEEKETEEEEGDEEELQEEKE
jgi:hypothetical protein